MALIGLFNIIGCLIAGALGKGHYKKYLLSLIYTGRTIAAIYASGSKKMTEGFGPKVDGFDQVPFADHEAVKKAINKNILKKIKLWNIFMKEVIY